MSNSGVLILVQGLAGSGKSHLIARLAHDYLIEENFAANVGVEAENIKDLIANLRCGRRCIVSERKYRSTANRTEFLKKITSAVQPPPHVRVICFENALDAANHNCRNRPDKPGDPGGVLHIAQNGCDTKGYQIPDDAIVVKIHKIAGHTI